MPAAATRPKLAAPLGVLSVAVMLYSVVIAQQLLFGFLVVGMIWVFYLLYIVVTTLGRIATAVERLADQRDEPNR